MIKSIDNTLTVLKAAVLKEKLLPELLDQITSFVELGVLQRNLEDELTKGPAYEKIYKGGKVSSVTRADCVVAIKLANEVNKVEFAVTWACKAWRAVYLALTDGKSGESQHQIDDAPATSFINHVSNLCLQSEIYGKRALSFIKETTAYLSAKALGQTELPNVSEPLITRTGTPLPGVLAGGWVYRWCKRVMSTTSGINLKEGLNALYIKLGCPPAPKEVVQSTLSENFVNLTTPRPESGQNRLRQRIHENIKTLAHHMFAGTKFSHKDYIPSSNASMPAFEMDCSSQSGTRATGGALGCLVRSWISHSKIWGTNNELERLFEHDLATSLSNYIPDGELLSMSYHPRNKGKKVCEQRLPRTLTSAVLINSFQDYVSDEVKKIIHSPELNEAKSAAIVEPLKVRVITKGNPFIYYRALELQKMMHSVMRGFAPFQLIGRPCSDDIFNRRFGRALSDDEFYVSGDYKAATDNLDPEFSRAAWDAICQEVNVVCGEKGGNTLSYPMLFSDWHKLGSLALTGHHMVQPDHEHDLKTPPIILKQEWGQLMGSPMSFPILCLVNAAATCAGLFLDPLRIFEADFPFLVNGDDISFICNSQKYTWWKKAVTEAGLTPSVGKNYTSREFCIINSECRVPHWSGVSNSWSYIPYLNLGLLLGIEKKGIDAGEDLREDMHWTEVGPRLQGLVRGMGPLRSSRISKLFEDRHQSVLEKMPPGLSRYLPANLLGAGLIGTKAIPEDNLRVAAGLAVLPTESLITLLSRPRAKNTRLSDVLSAEFQSHVAQAMGGYVWKSKEITPYLTNGIQSSWLLAKILDGFYTYKIKALELREEITPVMDKELDPFIAMMMFVASPQTLLQGQGANARRLRFISRIENMTRCRERAWMKKLKRFIQNVRFCKKLSPMKQEKAQKFKIGEELVLPTGLGRLDGTLPSDLLISNTRVLAQRDKVPTRTVSSLL